ncbi:hypothetical protein CBM2605_A60092 [Cupriavidus neocaledonicus]|uniref:Uncharacterized protein n=1 Tax=Cupriavidus neocaledonicus TaxID=1040979 RepID=A0ABY1V3C3_9BURK|nr:hypothetical protein CBM2605_A60092 [Cupriavidus neocaledonicus]
MLAVGAIEGGTLALDDLAHRLGAHLAWQAGAVVDKAIELEVAAGTVAADKVAQGAAAALDRLRQGVPHCLRQPVATRAAQAPGRRARMDAGAEQAFGCVDIAHAHHDCARQQHGLDRGTATARMAVQPGAVEGGIERLDAEGAQQRMRRQFRLRQRSPEDGAEAARIAEAQHDGAWPRAGCCWRRGAGPGLEHEVEVIVRARRWRLRQHPQRARHAQMHQQPAGRLRRVGADALQQQILAAALDPTHQALDQPRLEVWLDRPAQAAVAHRDRGYAPPHHMRQQAAPGHLDLGQFRHRTSPLVTAQNSCSAWRRRPAAPSSAL